MSSREDLLQTLQNGSKEEVRYAIEDLQAFADIEVVDAIIETVMRFKLKSITEVAKETLKSFASIAKDASLKSLKFIDSDEPKVRAAAIEIISHFGDESIAVLDILLGDKDYNRRKYGLDTLAEIQSSEALLRVEKMLNDENPNVKYTAMEYLVKFRNVKDEVENVISKTIKSIKPDEMYGITTLGFTIINGEYKNDAFNPILKDKLKDVDNEFIKHQIYKILLFLGDKSTIDEAMKNAKSINLEDDLDREIKLFLGE